MATSTMIENIKVNNPKVLEASEKAVITPLKNSSAKRITDSTELKDIMLRGIEKWGKEGVKF